MFQILADAAVLRYHMAMKKTYLIWRLLALALALCVLAGCSLFPGGIDDYLSEEDVAAILTELEADEPEAEPPAEAPAEPEEPETPAEPPIEAAAEATEPPAEAPAETETEAPAEPESEAPEEAALDPDGSYTSKEDVALYLHLYGRLPGNFITKSEAKKLGWSGGGLDGYADGKSIGGDRFGNYEGLLPDAEGREYHECDIDTMHASSRGAKRIVYSNDGLIYYTDDHYESYTLLYPEE